MPQTKNFENRRYNQKVAAFNLGVSEAVKVIIWVVKTGCFFIVVTGITTKCVCLMI